MADHDTAMPHLTVVALHGAIDRDSAASLRSCIVGGVQDGADVVLDLSDVALLDCASLGSVMRAHHAARNAGRRVRLPEPSPLVRKTLSVTGVDAVLPVFHDRREALSRFASAPPR